jgi:hypothetical protein
MVCPPDQKERGYPRKTVPKNHSTAFASRAGLVGAETLLNFFSIVIDMARDRKIISALPRIPFQMQSKTRGRLERTTMKKFVCLLGLSASLFDATSTRAATLIWTNVAGGDWNVAANWTPAQVPSGGDGVIITNSGTYTVTNTVGVTLHDLTLGGTNGTQILTISSLTLTNLGLINSNGVLNLNGGDLEGALTIAQGGTLTQTNTLQFAYNNYGSGYTNTAYLTNYGTVVWAGTIYGSGNSSSHGGGGFIYNAGLWNAVADMTLDSYNGVGTNYFINTGTLEKTGGTGTSSINWAFSNNGGTVNTPSGAFSMGNWIGNGVLHGTATFVLGTITGTLASDCVVNSSATVTGSMIVSSNALANWNGGDLEGALTVAQGGTLTQSNNLHFAYNNYSVGNTNTTYLTNYGTVIWAGTIDAAGNGSSHAGGGIIYNAGLWNAVADMTMGSYNGVGTNYFFNTGTLEKTGATGTSTIGWNFSSSGIIQTFSGTFNLNWSGPSVLNGNLSLSGTISTPLTIASNAVLNLYNGDLESALTVAQGGTLTQSNSLHFAYNNYSVGSTNTAYLTNYGTVIWAGTIDASGNGSSHGGGGFIYNAGLWDAVSDMTMGSYNGVGTNYFINAGTLEKTAGTGTSEIDWNFDSEGGALETLSGYFTFGGIWSANSLVYGNATFSGNIGGIIGPNATITWLGGDLEGTLTVAQGGTLTQSNTLQFAYKNYSVGSTNTAYLTNYGTVIWAGIIEGSGNSSSHGGGGVIYNAGLWVAVSDTTMDSYNGVGTNYFINTGTVEKIGGTATSTLAWLVKNGGIIGSQTHTLSLTGNYDLSAGTLNFGINNSNDFGVVSLSGSPATLAGSLLANFNNGYVAATGSTFPGLTYTAESGTFTNFNLPFAVAWQTNYGGTSFTLTVLNVRPVLGTIAPQTVDELTSLNVTATATDMDAGQSLAFALVSAPGGMTNNPTTGAISWIPAQTQSPSTNVVLVSVTDNGTPPLSATNSFTVIVREVNVAPTLPGIPLKTVNALALLTVTNTATESNIHATLGYLLLNPPNGASIGNGGVITWTPSRLQGPSTNTITTVVTNTDVYDQINPHLAATNNFTVIVYAPTLAPIANTNVNAGQTVAFTASATDNDNTRTLSFSVLSGPGSIGPSTGSYSWRATAASAGTSNFVQIQVSDNSIPPVTDTKGFGISVNALAPVTLTPIAHTNGQFLLQITGPLGPDYVFQAAPALSNNTVWLNLQTNTPGTSPFTVTDTNAGALTTRFYRVQLRP